MESQQHQLPPIVPKAYAGKWIAWSHDGTRMVAVGQSLADVERAAAQAGELQPRYERIPPADARVVGAAR